jgi:hypothetical protein
MILYVVTRIAGGQQTPVLQSESRLCHAIFADMALGPLDPGAETRRRQPFLRRASEQTLLIEREACSRAPVQQRQSQSYSGYRANHSGVEE